ncbi:MAG: tyrosine-type recombinase/integrase [Rhizobiaceae bacterium]|nr:tyrosine-type recombinase/integrase [Rhizobiaceae bacterium]
MKSNKIRISKRVVDNLQPGNLVWDTDIVGFAVRRQRRDKIYALKARVAGRQRWFSIGLHGNPWTPDAARREALAILGEIAKGLDPALMRDAESKIPSVKKLADRFMDEEVKPKRKPNTIIQYQDFLDRLVEPKIGKLRVDQVKLSDIAALHHGIRKTPYQANRVLAVLSAMFSWAGLVGIRERNTNPCIGISKFKEQKRERFLSVDELANIGEVLRQCEQDETETPYAIGAIRLLIFTGCRRDEILTLKWNYIDTDKSVLYLPDSKTGQKVVHLNAPALETLSKIPKIEGNEFVIVGKREGERLVNIRKIWFRICALAEIEGVRVHDLRHSFASVGASGGASLLIIGKLLGQTQAATTARYAHLADDPIKTANEKIGQEIAAAMSGKSAKILPLKKKGS